MNDFFSQILRDKDGSYNLREVVTLTFVLVTLVSWIAHQFFGMEVPEYMFYSFVSIVGAGCFGYSIEQRASLPNEPSMRSEINTNGTKNEQL